MYRFSSVLASGMPVWAWLQLELWQAALLTALTPVYVIILGVATGASEGLRDWIYQLITGRPHR